MVTININDTVHVRLTDKGRRLLYENDILFNIPHKPKEEDSEGWSRWQLWELMARLGKDLCMGFSLPIDPTIKVETRR